MHDNRDILERRIERTLVERILPAQYTKIAPLTLEHYRIPLENGIIAEPISFNEAKTAPYTPFTLGTTWGAPWQTTWFRTVLETPANLELSENDELEAVFDLGWEDHSVGFQCEALIRDANGETLKALNPKNRWLPLDRHTKQQEIYIEAAANPLLLAVPPFQVTYDGDKLTASQTDLYTFRSADLCIKHADVYHLALDIAVLRELIAVEKDFTDWHWRILFTLNDALDALDLNQIPATAPKAREILKPVLTAPALPGAHQLSAVGHAHIDTAWLWPLRETRRKVIRTLANVVRLIEDGTGLIFALPAAQHLEWVKQDDPNLFTRIKTCVENGSIVPVGGMWVEPDAVLPGGEALCRQLTEGMSWLEENLGYTCKEIWLPDSFGYSAALPQIAREAGIERFLTQKISWNQVNVFPHHTLLWEGIDGSRIFTHFPPADTYGSDISGANLHHAVNNFKNKGRANCSLLPFGYGDGGGGPTREMIERISRYSNLQGAPVVKMESPVDFFDKAIADQPQPPVWVGELYLELHRGTLTSQIATKQGNRRNEALLREAELWATMAALNGVRDYPLAELRELWRNLLLCQFHDILPGTSIAWVHREVKEIHAETSARLEAIINASLTALTAGGDQLLSANASSYSLGAAAPLSISAEPLTTSGAATQNTQPAHPVTTNSVTTNPVSNPTPVTIDRERREISNGIITARFNQAGECESLVEVATGREYLPANAAAGVLHVHQDFPNMWDAWDIDPFYRGSQTTVETRQLKSLTLTDGQAIVKATATYGQSEINLTWSLAPGETGLDLQVEASWWESEKLLKLGFPVDIHTDQAEYETQMGFIKRNTHENTSWDAYKFEAGAHRWIRIANAGAALAIANNATYGWDVTRHARGNRGTWSLVRATLIKTAVYPDPHQDQGNHSWKFRLIPGASVENAVAAGQDINLGRRKLTGKPVAPLFTLEGLTTESVALAPDGSGDVIIRAYEPTGGPANATLTLLHPRLKQPLITDLRYQPVETKQLTQTESRSYSLEVSPFQIITLRIPTEGSAK
ncbi:glycosyl hydrolase-related protein [Gleimia sp. 6138-11-ORH1]|uniref:alpha-mannosidase n=1 Tax=Gleimia sp. 6138-11-ORH1 TaxID=2973937 RepID=UPI002166E32E|nr:alpha-mannosidase [Gleimia sp. 6138-11-ORH1]MCS4485174.1 glycosyl hydrolase-related protein [Gleimia sp. 6138-11-ORH1]